MAKPEQTEKATPKRKDEARQRGQIAKSPDLTGAIIFIIAVVVIHAVLMRAMGGWGWTMQKTLQHISGHEDLTIFSVWTLFLQALGGIWMLLGVLLLSALVVAILANIAQFGFLITLKPLQPSLNKINPLTGFQRLFSKTVFVNLGKQLAKLTAVALIVYPSLAGNLPMFYTLASASPTAILLALNDIIYGIGIRFGILLLLVGIFDYFWQRHQLEDSLKMTKQEVKDEWKQQEGSQEAKGAFKRRQRELYRRRMMHAVPRATVVVTNPTHYAVALEWDEVKMDAPVVTAKGADLMAKRIRELAREHNVPIMENPPLARTLYAQVELEQAIPPNLYAAVAQVIAFVFKLKRRTG